MLEIIASSPQVATGAPGVFAMTATFNEPGTVYPSRLVANVANTVVLAGGSMNQLPVCSVVALTSNGSTLLQRGRNGGQGTGNIFSGIRFADFVDLPALPVQSGDTLQLVLDNTPYLGANVVSSFSLPMLPDRFKGRVPMNIPAGGAGGEVLQSSPLVPVASGGLVPLTVTIDTPGYIDLSRSTCQLNLPPTAGPPALDVQDGMDATRWGELAQLIVRNDYNIVVGQGVPIAPLSQFGPTRPRNFVKLGIHKVVPGDTIVATVRQTSGIAGTGSWSIPLYPYEGGQGGIPVGGACRIC